MNLLLGQRNREDVSETKETQYQKEIVLRSGADEFYSKLCNITVHESTARRGGIYIRIDERDTGRTIASIRAVRNGRKLRISRISVAYDLQSKGLGTQMMQMFESVALNVGYHVVEVYPLSAQIERTIKFYEGLGYTFRNESRMEKVIESYSSKKLYQRLIRR